MRAPGVKLGEAWNGPLVSCWDLLWASWGDLGRLLELFPLGTGGLGGLGRMGGLEGTWAFYGAAQSFPFLQEAYAYLAPKMAMPPPPQVWVFIFFPYFCRHFWSFFSPYLKLSNAWGRIWAPFWNIGPSHDFWALIFQIPPR